MTDTPIATMVLEMIRRGVDPEMIALAVSTAETVAASTPSGGIPVDTTAEKRRAWDRNRKRQQQTIHRNSGGIPPDPPDAQNAPLSIRKKEVIKQEEREAPQRAVHRTVRGHRLPADWQPTEPDLAAAEALIGADRTRSELAKFADHWKQQPGSRGVKLDWDATWRNWARRASEFLTKGGTTNGRTTIHDAARNLTRQLQLVAQFDEPAPRELFKPAG
jgi:hypothetical protein